MALRFEDPSSGVDQWRRPNDAFSIDFERLRGLRDDEPAYGAALTDMVFAADVTPFYARALAVTERGAKLRLRLNIDAPAPFHALRWESLRDPVNREPIATLPNVLLSRYRSNPDWPNPVLGNQGPRALIVVAGPWDLRGHRVRGGLLAPVEVNEELALADRALADFEVVDKLAFGTATLANMTEALHRGIDILYLACRWSLGDDVPQLYLEKSDGTADVIDGGTLIKRLSELERPPTVVMVCSCQSPSADTETWTADEGQLSGLGPPLVAAGVAAVVAMPANVSLRTATTFAPVFFAAFAAHGIVDKAMAAARATIRGEKDWWVPVLFSRLRTGRAHNLLFKSVGGPATTTWEELEALVAEHRLTPVLGSGLPDSILGVVPYIVRRWVQRWQLPIAPRDQGNLAKVAQYLVRNASRGSMLSQFQEHLAQEISDRRNHATSADLVWDLPDDLLTPDNLELAIRKVGRNLRMMDMMDPHRIMAALPLPVYVTAEWTYLLEDALVELGKQPMTRRFDWTDKADWDDDLKDFKPTVQHPLVYHLFGHLDNPDSLVLTEDDHFEWLKAWLTRRSSIPRAVAQALTAQSLLFLDCRLDVNIQPSGPRKGGLLTVGLWVWRKGLLAGSACRVAYGRPALISYRYARCARCGRAARGERAAAGAAGG